LKIHLDGRILLNCILGVESRQGQFLLLKMKTCLDCQAGHGGIENENF